MFFVTFIRATRHVKVFYTFFIFYFFDKKNENNIFNINQNKDKNMQQGAAKFAASKAYALVQDF